MTVGELLKIYRKAPASVRFYIYLRYLLVDFNRLISLIPGTPHKIQELGCGYGIFSFLLAQKYSQSKVSSCDADSTRIQKLQALNPFPNLSPIILCLDLENQSTIFEKY